MTLFHFLQHEIISIGTRVFVSHIKYKMTERVTVKVNKFHEMFRLCLIQQKQSLRQQSAVSTQSRLCGWAVKRFKKTRFLFIFGRYNF